MVLVTWDTIKETVTCEGNLILSGLLLVEVYTQIVSPDASGSCWGPQNLCGLSQTPYFLPWQEPKADSCLYGQLSYTLSHLPPLPQKELLLRAWCALFQVRSMQLYTYLRGF